MHASITDYHWTDEQRWIDLIGLKTISCSKASDIQKLILTTNDIALAPFYARDIGFEAFKMQQLVISSNNPKLITLFAAIVPNADIPTLQSLVIKSKDATSMVRFAFYVPNANIKPIQKAIIDLDNHKAAGLLLKHCPSASVNALKSTILKSRDPTSLLELARRIKSKQVIKQIEDILVKDKAIKHCRLFAHEIEGANTKRLEKMIMDSGDLKEIKALARNKKSKAAGLAILF